jgi:hypothetical protein
MRKTIWILSVVSVAAFSQDCWSNDVLIWGFTGGVTSPGTGYQTHDGLYGAGGAVYAAAVQSRPENPNGDLVVLRKSSDHGYTWTRQITITTGNGNTAFTPRLVFCDGGASVVLFVAFQFYNGETGVYGYKYGAESLNFIDFYTVDSSYPGMEPIRSFTINPGCGGYYYGFMETTDNWLYLSVTQDFDNWSPAQPVAANVVRASATGGPGTRVAAAWYDPYQLATVCVTGASGTMGTPVKVGDAPSGAAPIPAWEEGGSENLGVFWHGSGGSVLFSLSGDYGATWTSPSPLASGVYPFADIYNGSTPVAVCYVGASGEVFTGIAASLAGVGSMSFTQRNDYPAYALSPAVIRQSSESGGTGLMYLSADGVNLWFDNAMFPEGIEGPEQSGEQWISVFPNPSAGTVTIRVFPDGGEASVGVYSLDGRLVWSGSTAGGEISREMNLPAGIYTVSAVRGGSRLSSRMILL